jgi:hypothetical protein
VTWEYKAAAPDYVQARKRILAVLEVEHEPKVGIVQVQNWRSGQMQEQAYSRFVSAVIS